MEASPEVVDIEQRAAAASVPMPSILERAGVAQTTWWRWTQGKFEPRLSTLRQVRDALDAEIEARGAA